LGSLLVWVQGRNASSGRPGFGTNVSFRLSGIGMEGKICVLV